MINYSEKLRLNREALSDIEDALYSLKSKVYEKNPELFFSMSQDYVKSISEIRAEIDHQLGLELLNEYKAPLWIRLVGEYINIWNTPISVWSSVLKNLKDSVSSVAKVIKGNEHISDNIINSLSDFDVTGIEAGSLKIGFDIHSKGQYELFENKEINKATDLIKEALIKILETSYWFAKGSKVEELDKLFESESIRNYVIAKTLNLMPSPRSKFSIIEYSGSILPVDKPITLNIKSRKRVREILKKEHHEIEIDKIGVIREIDLDKKHFILRQIEDGGPDLMCKFTDENYNLIKDILDKKVKIFGVLKKGNSSPIYLKFVETMEE
ncbi:MAG: hypothetical protein WAT71_13710 [Ignavibacteria bacterium]